MIFLLVSNLLDKLFQHSISLTIEFLISSSFNVCNFSLIFALWLDFISKIISQLSLILINKLCLFIIVIGLDNGPSLMVEVLFHRGTTIKEQIKSSINDKQIMCTNSVPFDDRTYLTEPCRRFRRTPKKMISAVGINFSFVSNLIVIRINLKQMIALRHCKNV